MLLAECPASAAVGADTCRPSAVGRSFCRVRHSALTCPSSCSGNFVSPLQENSWPWPLLWMVVAFPLEMTVAAVSLLWPFLSPSPCPCDLQDFVSRLDPSVQQRGVADEMFFDT